VTLEQVVEAQPDVVLLPAETFFEGDAASLHALDIPAAQHERIYLMDGTLLTWAGTRVAYALRDLPALFLKETE
jgi:ABC-type hemin transport system substrate-binding protein